MKSIKFIVLNIGVAIFSIFLLLGCLSLVNSGGKKHTENKIAKTLKKTKINEQTFSINSNDKLIKCLNSNAKNKLNCFKEDVKEQKTKLVLKDTSVFFEILLILKKTQLPILMIYLSQLLCLHIVIFLVIQNIINKHSKATQNKINKISAIIQMAPSLGLTGTFLGLSFFIAQSNNGSSLLETYRVNILDAIGTTVFGVLVLLIATITYTYMGNKKGVLL